VAEPGSHPIVSHDPTIDLDKTLVDAVDELGADLVVMGSHIPRHFELRNHGAHLAQLTHHSVMLVRDET
jgi:nucleotide-binding universal stress UspA family protein